MTRRTTARWSALVFGLAVLGCDRTTPAPPAPPPPTVGVAKPVMIPVQSYYEYNGYLDSVEMVQVKARVKGVLEKVYFNEGDDIVAGAELYTIDPREYQSEVSKAERRDDHLLSTLRRYIEALGGELEVVARFGDKSVRLKGV